MQQVEGKAMYLIDPKCTMLIRGFKSGYRYKIKRSGEMEDKPDKNEYSHCFVGETPVLTPTGYQRIDSIQVGDLVVTRSGARRVTATMMQRASDLVQVSTTARSVTCTPNHPFIVDGKKVRADSLKYANILVSNQGENQCASESTQSKRSKASRITASLAATTRRTTQWAARTYTAMFGSTTTGQSQKNITSTTWMGINGTTILETCNSSARLITRRITDANGLLLTQTVQENTCAKPSCRPPRHGTQAQKESSGTENMAPRLGMGVSPQSLFVRTVSSISSAFQKCRSVGFVQPSASLLRAAPAGSTTKPEAASAAGATSSSTSTQKHVTAASVAVRRIDAVCSTMVYDLTVEVDHEFVAGGFLVSNCHDANQYADSVIDMNVRGVGLDSANKRREVKPAPYRYT
jgi:hypothetical protein